MPTSSAPSRSARSRTSPVVAAIGNRADLPLVLVAAAQAKRRGAALALLNVTLPDANCSVVSRPIPVPVPRAAVSGCDPGVSLRDRALTLAQLARVEVIWLSAVGYPDDVVARFCRDNRAALIVLGASRNQLATWRRQRMLAAAAPAKAPRPHAHAHRHDMTHHRRGRTTDKENS